MITAAVSQLLGQSWASCFVCGLTPKMIAKMRVKRNNFKILYTHTMSDNKLVKSILDAATITGLVAGIGWIGRKTIKENFTADPSANIMNYIKFTAAMAASIALKKYLEDQKILPDNI